MICVRLLVVLTTQRTKIVLGLIAEPYAEPPQAYRIWYQTWISVYSITMDSTPRYSSMATSNVGHADMFSVRILIYTITKALLRQNARTVAICSLCLFLAHHAHAGIKTCTLADGSVVFQDTACTVVPKTEKKSAPIANVIPLGIDQSWFDKPSVSPHQVECTKSGCDCGKYYREFKNGLALAIADALYLDGSWHRFEAKMSQMEIHTPGSVEYNDLRLERNEAACNILMSQKTLRLFGESVLKKLRTQKRHAENIGWDNPADCEAGDLKICEHTDNIDLYHRIVSDLQTLGSTARIDDDSLQKSENAKSE